MDAGRIDDLGLLASKQAQAEFLLHCGKPAAKDNALYETQIKLN